VRDGLADLRHVFLQLEVMLLIVFG
jgi:hypothetical protein